MGAGFSRINSLTIIQTSQGIAEHVLASQREASLAGIVVGYDGRHNSKHYAELAAAAFIAKGIKVWWYEDIVHTPLVPFAVKHLKAAAGIMITASHNPAQDNGYKVYSSTACQINAPVDGEISSFISRNLEPQTWDVTQLSTSNHIRNIREPMLNLYIGNVWDFVSQYSCRTGKHDFPAFVYSPLHGVGLHFMEKATRALVCPLDGSEMEPIRMVVVEEQARPDPNFPTVTFPNPEEAGTLDLAKKTADVHGIALIIVNDPDADRLAVAEKIEGNRWVQYTGDQLGVLLAHYLLSQTRRENETGSDKTHVLCSAVSSQMLSVIARDMDVSFAETLTGFKWLGNCARNIQEGGAECLFAYEEALGYMFPSVLFDKDGILAAAVFLSACRQWQSPWGELQKLYRKYGCFVTMNTYWRSPDINTISECFRKIRDLDKPSAVADRRVVRWRDMTIGYDSASEDGVPVLPDAPGGQMITCWLSGLEEDEIRFTIRASGTEPKLKSKIFDSLRDR